MMHMRPRRLNAAVAWLFMIGSACFALGALPVYSGAVSGTVDAATYFVGSLFFTSASFLQLAQVQSPLMAPGADTGAPAEVLLRAWLPHDLNWVAAATQFPGTLAFNVSTAFAISASLSVQQANRVVWRPDFVGSVLFLVSSAFAITALTRGAGVLPRVIAWVNMAGSVAFMVSALGSFMRPATGQTVNLHWDVAGTFWGAVCFFVAAGLLLPAWRAAQGQPATN
jgi:hypothetical protein